MAVYAQVSDVEDRLGDTVPDEGIGQVETLLDDAEAILTATVGGLADRILAGRTTAENIARVAANMVVRVLRNPNGLRQEQYPEYSFVRDTQISSGGLVLTREDRRLLGIRAGAVTVPVADTALPHVLRRPWDVWPELTNRSTPDV